MPSPSSQPEDFKALLQAQGVKAIRLAEYLGVPRSSISRWQSGKIGTISSDTTLRIAEFLSVDPSRVIHAVQVSRARYLAAHPEVARQRHARKPQPAISA